MTGGGGGGGPRGFFIQRLPPLPSFVNNQLSIARTLPCCIYTRFLPGGFRFRRKDLLLPPPPSLLVFSAALVLLIELLLPGRKLTSFLEFTLVSFNTGAGNEGAAREEGRKGRRKKEVFYRRKFEGECGAGFFNFYFLTGESR